jgi:putative ABC transport system permease protein
MAQHERFVDVSQGTGTLFVGLACILIGGAFPVGYRLIIGLASSAAGAIMYAFLIAVALGVGMAPGDLKALTAVLVILAALAGQRIFPTESRLSMFS